MKYKLHRKAILSSITITSISYILLIFLSGGFTQIKLYNKYSKLNKDPKMLQENIDTKTKEAAKNRSGIFGFVDSINRGTNTNKPTVTKGFAESQQVEDVAPMVAKDLTEYRNYIDNPNPDDPDLDSKMVQSLKISIYKSVGYSTLLAIIIFVLVLTLIDKKQKSKST